MSDFSDETIRAGLLPKPHEKRPVDRMYSCEDPVLARIDPADALTGMWPMDDNGPGPTWLRYWRRGWHDALFVFGLRDCSVTNEGTDILRIPVGRREAYIDLAPGETVSIRAIVAAEPAPSGIHDGDGEPIEAA